RGALAVGRLAEAEHAFDLEPGELDRVVPEAQAKLDHRVLEPTVTAGRQLRRPVLEVVVLRREQGTREQPELEIVDRGSLVPALDIGTHTVTRRRGDGCRRIELLCRCRGYHEGTRDDGDRETESLLGHLSVLSNPLQ